MTRHDKLKHDPAFREAAHALRGTASVMTGVQMTYGEAEMLALMTLVTFTNAGGLSEPTVGHLTRLAPEAGEERSSGSATLQ
ncbi:hypothetical protein [Methylobacterium planeticum]|uniref:Uncharacterized protein n=1 Tax=Methylobacterium planeticum TaxID=2615211 RepID=A0A6N6MEM2_9HYPH|nr:hypothetical protein [Methylobacterium planeticum]KAB1068184.1 hypothetical protein F6X51_27120 [Methylobacterium planeticum]